MQSAIITPADEQTFVVLGNLLQFLNEPGIGQDDVCVMTVGLPSEAVIPLHSHADPELFFLLQGTLDVYQEATDWSTATAGQLVAIPGHVKHALRNADDGTVRAILISKTGIHDFFRELAQPFDSDFTPNQGSPKELEALFAAAARHGYWIASPGENAAIGIFLA